MKQVSEQEMLHRMAAYCSAGERCIRDVEKKIEAAGLPPEAAERIISRLLKEKYIDENRYARSFVNDKLRFNKWGRIKIAYELHRKNISPAVAQAALAYPDDSEYLSILSSLLREKKKSVKGKDGREVYAQLLRFAAGRGFEHREAVRCLRELFNGDNDYADNME
ncbi:MAG: RecX family transcriptional regulator [Bacteroidales bacterium]